MRLVQPVVSRAPVFGWLKGLILICSMGSVAAQSLRDPTLPPAESGFAGNTSVAKPMGVEPGAMTVIVRNGRPFVVVGTRLYAQGQKLGQARIERISETEIWLREGGVLHKLSQFPGIQRRAVALDAVKPVCAPSTSKNNREVSIHDSKSSCHD